MFDETIYAANDPKAKIPLKKGLDPKKYGGYSSVKNAYYVAIEYQKGKKQVKQIIGIPIYKLPAIKKDGLKQYLIEQENIKKCDTVKILKEKIKRYQLVEYQGHKVYLISNAEQQNAVQLIIDDKYKELIAKISTGKISYELKNKEEYDLLMMSFFDCFNEKLKTNYPIYENMVEDLKSSRADFMSFEISLKADFVKELLLITKASATRGGFGKFKTIFKNNAAGRIQKSWKVEDMVFIDQSITGMHERRYSL